MKKILLSVLALLAFTFGGTAQTLPSYVPVNGLVGWWPFNGNANDESGNNNNGTVNGATLTADRFGNAGNAYGFDGINDNITTDISYSTSDQAKSVSLWVKFKNLNDRGWVIGNNVGCQPGTTSSGFGLFTTNSELWFHGDGFVADIPNVLTFDTTKFYNVVATHEFSTTKIFVNGVFVSSENNQLNTSNGTFLIGSRVDSPIDPNCLEEWFEGIVDDIAIYNRALTQQEITGLYQGTNTTANCPTFPASLTQGLVGYWPFCGNALDESGNNNHGTVNGATLTTDHTCPKRLEFRDF
jgi:hypothetical protein